MKILIAIIALMALTTSALARDDMQADSYNARPVTFANLGVACSHGMAPGSCMPQDDGTSGYCSNCQAFTTPCVGGGSGSYVTHQAGGWACGSSSGGGGGGGISPPAGQLGGTAGAPLLRWFPITTITTNTSAAFGAWYDCNAALTLTLPASTGNGQFVGIRNIASSGTCTIAPNSGADTIIGQTLIGIQPGQSLTFQDDFVHNWNATLNLSPSGATPGGYTCANITINGAGQILSASNGTCTSPAVTITAGPPLTASLTGSNYDIELSGIVPQANGGTNTVFGPDGMYRVFGNDPTTGTAMGQLVMLSAADTVITAPMGTVSGVIGTCYSGCGTTGTSVIKMGGLLTCIYDGAPVPGHYAQVSTTQNGKCTDSGFAPPTRPTSGTQIIGIVDSTANFANSLNTIFFPSDQKASGGGTTYTAIPPITIDGSNNIGLTGVVPTIFGGTGNSTGPIGLVRQFTNDAVTGTLTSRLVSYTSAQTMIKTSAGASAGAMGVCQSGCGIGGQNVVQFNGVGTCVFDGAHVPGNYAIISSSVAGDCTDSGIAPPSRPPPGTQIIGLILNAGNFVNSLNILLFGPDQANGATAAAAITSGSIAAGAYLDVPLTWTSAFADTNYTAVCDVKDTTDVNGPGLAADHISVQSTTGISVTIHNGSSTSAVTGTVGCHAEHN